MASTSSRRLEGSSTVEPVLIFRAGKCERSTDPKSHAVIPSSTPGQVAILRSDGKLWLVWYETSAFSKDIALENYPYLSPGEVVLEKMDQSEPGRIFRLSDNVTANGGKRRRDEPREEFYWLQRPNSQAGNDAQLVKDIHSLLRDITYIPVTTSDITHPIFWLPEPVPRQTLPTSTADTTVEDLSEPMPAERSAAAGESISEPSSAGQADAGSAPPADPADPTQQMARMLMEWAEQGGIASTAEDARLVDILSPSNISNLVNRQPALIPILRSLLPAELNLPETITSAELIPILTAPQFTDAISSLDSALRSGGLPGAMMRQLGLSEGAGTGIKAFINALCDLDHSRDDSSRMDG